MLVIAEEVETQSQERAEARGTDAERKCEWQNEGKKHGESWPRRCQKATEKVKGTLEMLRDWGEQKVKRLMIGEATECKKSANREKARGLMGLWLINPE